MEIEHMGREKRKADTQPINVDDENSKAEPHASPRELPTMSVEQLVRYSIEQNEKNFSKLDRDITHLQKEGAETRRMACSRLLLP